MALDEHTKAHIRHAFLSDNAETRSFSISQKDVEMLRFVQENQPVAAADVEIRYARAMNNVGAKLKKLFDQGYLLRKEKPQPSGGYYFEYSLMRPLP